MCEKRYMFGCEVTIWSTGKVEVKRGKEYIGFFIRPKRRYRPW